MGWRDCSGHRALTDDDPAPVRHVEGDRHAVGIARGEEEPRGSCLAVSVAHRHPREVRDCTLRGRTRGAGFRHGIRRIRGRLPGADNQLDRRAGHDRAEPFRELRRGAASRPDDPARRGGPHRDVDPARLPLVDDDGLEVRVLGPALSELSQDRSRDGRVNHRSPSCSDRRRCSSR